MSSVDDPGACLAPTALLDADHPAVRAFTAQALGEATDSIERAVRLFHAVRDGLRYEPYAIDLSPEGFRASTVLASGRGFCVTKAGVLAAAARGAGIPARLGFANVRNHLATARLRQLMGTDVFYYHGYTELWLGGRWVKATPAFNIELCDRFGVRPLAFDGHTDAVFHPFDTEGRRHMEYLHDHGVRADMPFEEIRDALLRHYPIIAAAAGVPAGDFHAEAAAEGAGERERR